MAIDQASENIEQFIEDMMAAMAKVFEQYSVTPDMYQPVLDDTEDELRLMLGEDADEDEEES